MRQQEELRGQAAAAELARQQALLVRRGVGFGIRLEWTSRYGRRAYECIAHQGIVFWQLQCSPLQDHELARLAAEAEQRGAALEQHYSSAVAVQTARMSAQHKELAAAHAALRGRCAQLEREAQQAGAALRTAQLAAAAAQQAQHEAATAAEQQAQEREAARAVAERRAADAEQLLAEARAAAAEAAGAARQRRAAELEELQQRFLGLLSTKDATIAALRQQLGELSASLVEAVGPA